MGTVRVGEDDVTVLAGAVVKASRQIRLVGWGMRSWIRAWGFLALGYLGLACAPLLAVQGGPLTAGYLVDEMFADLGPNWQNTSQCKLSDWDVDARAGNVSYGYWNYGLLTDTSTSQGLELRKRFIPQASGSIIVEFAFNGAAANGRVWSVRSGWSLDAVKFMTSGGNFGYENSSGSFVSLIPNVSWQNLTVRAIVYPASNRFDVYINGVSYGSNLVFRNPCASVDGFFIGTSTTGTDEFQMKYVLVLKGFTVYERFTNAAAGQTPSGWGPTTAGGVSTPVSWGTTNPKDTLSFKLEDTSSSLQATLNKSYAAMTGKIAWEFKFLLPVKFDGAVMFIRDNGSAYVAKVGTSSGHIVYTKSDGTNGILWDNYKANVWYTVRAVADTATKTVNYYVNGKLCAGGVAFPSASASQAVAMAFGTSVANTGTMWLDDIYLYPFTPEPSDYVPALQPVSGTGHYVGVQTFFSGWRLGHHGSWDWLYRFPNHDPYLGFFDEGIRESMDWQLKWMYEAGIDFLMDDWYMAGASAPIKEPLFQYTQGPIHEGYFYAKYSGDVKLAIADFSISNLSSASFRNYVVPYWIEYYFRDSRYMTIGNKPVIGFGQAVNWMNSLGVAGMRAEIDYLRAQLVAMGYDGAICLALYSGNNAGVMQNLRDAGMDACYAYNFGTTDIYSIENAINSAKSAGASLGFVPVATSYLGRNGEAWDQANLGQITPANFESMNNWIKNAYMPSVAAGLPGRDMVLFANWNEYGEGSFLAPTNLTGFDYLNKIRSVFAVNSYSNALPSAAQLARMNVLYSRGWDGRYWGFDSLYPDTEGWTANSHISGFAQNKGFIEGTIINNDPVLFSRNGYSIPTATYSRIVVRMKNMTAATTARIYFITDTNPSYLQAQSKSFSLTPNDTVYRDYVINMAGTTGWSGNLKQIRLDPVDTATTSPGTFSIDYIRIAEP